MTPVHQRSDTPEFRRSKKVDAIRACLPITAVASFDSLVARLCWYEELQGDMNDADFHDQVRGENSGV